MEIRKMAHTAHTCVLHIGSLCDRDPLDIGDLWSLFIPKIREAPLAIVEKSMACNDRIVAAFGQAPSWTYPGLDDV